MQLQKKAEEGVGRKLSQDEKYAYSELVGQLNSVQVLYVENNIHAHTLQTSCSHSVTAYIVRLLHRNVVMQYVVKS